MKKVTKLVSLFMLFPLSSAILTGYETENITNDRKFGCSWLGGNSPAVICTCQEDAEEMKINKYSISSYDTSTIEIKNCKKVTFSQESVAEMRNLRNIHLQNIKTLYFEQSSLKWYGYSNNNNPYEENFDRNIPSLKIVIENSTITQISDYTFSGRINTIRFENVLIENVEPFAFNALMQTQEITLKNVELKNVREQTFKKFSTEILEFNQVKAKLIPSRYVHNITVYNVFRITNCDFESVRSGAFIVSNPRNFEVIDTKINQLDGEAFKVTTRGDVLFRNNKFNIINDGAFRAIFLHPEEALQATITFDSNVFTTLTRDSLGINDDFRPKFFNLFINETCDCKSIDHNIKDAEFYSEIKCKYENEFVTIEEYKTNMCSIIQSYSNVIIIVIVVFTLCFIIATVLVVYYRRVYLSRKYGSEKDSKKGNMSLIVPDGRTYRETELHVIVERADLLTTDL